MYHTARVPLPKQQQHGGVRYPLPPQFDPQVLEKSLGLSHFHLGCRYFDFGLIGFFSFVSTAAVSCSTVATSLLWLCLGLDLGSAGHLAAESQTVNRRVCSFVPGGHANCSNAQCGPSISFISHSAVATGQCGSLADLAAGFRALPRGPPEAGRSVLCLSVQLVVASGWSCHHLSDQAAILLTSPKQLLVCVHWHCIERRG